MEIEENQKLTVLLSLLNERYNASHKMRERSLKFTIWVLGFALALIWLLIKGDPLHVTERAILTVVVVLGIAISFWFLCSIKIGFDKNRGVTIKIEEVLGCYKMDYYDKEETLYPKEYKQKKKGIWSHFKSIYILMFPIAILLIVLIWIRPYPDDKKTMKIENNNPQVEKRVEKR